MPIAANTPMHELATLEVSEAAESVGRGGTVKMSAVGRDHNIMTDDDDDEVDTDAGSSQTVTSQPSLLSTFILQPPPPPAEPATCQPNTHHYTTRCGEFAFGAMTLCLQCFDAVGWAAGRASSL